MMILRGEGGTGKYVRVLTVCVRMLMYICHGLFAAIDCVVHGSGTS